MFSNVQEVFCWFFLNYTDFAHQISHTKPSQYDSTLYQNLNMFEKSWGDEAVDRNKHL